MVTLSITLLLFPSLYYQLRYSPIWIIILPVYWLVSVSLTQDIQQGILGYQMKNEAENLSSNLQKEHRIISVHLRETFCPHRSVKMKFDTRRIEEKLYWLESDVQSYVCLYPIKAVGLHPMYHKCAKAKKDKNNLHINFFIN